MMQSVPQYASHRSRQSPDNRSAAGGSVSRGVVSPVSQPLPQPQRCLRHMHALLQPLRGGISLIYAARYILTTTVIVYEE